MSVLEYDISLEDRPKLSVVQLEELRTKVKGIIEIFENLHSELDDLDLSIPTEEEIYQMIAETIEFDEERDDINYDGILETIDVCINEKLELAKIFELHDQDQHAMMFDEPDEEDDDYLYFQCRIEECDFQKKVTHEEFENSTHKSFKEVVSEK